jgi:hypothetical protein
MASTFDLVNRSQSDFNTGTKGSRVPFDKVTGLFFAPLDYNIDLTADLATQLAADARAADANDRIYSLGNFAECADNSSEARTESFSYGLTRTVADGYYIVTFMPADLDKALQKAMRKFNGAQRKFKVFLVDDQNRIYCTKNTAGEAVGFSLMNIWTDKWKFNTGEGVKNGISLSFSNARELNEGLHVINAEFDVIGNMPQVNSVVLEVATALSSGVVDVYVWSNDGQDNLLDDYGTELAATSAWVPIAKTSGTAITVSAVSLVNVAGKRAMRITMTTNLPSIGQQLILKGAAMSVWNGLGVVDYENSAPGQLTLTV